MGDAAVVTGQIITSESGFLRGHGTYIDHGDEKNNQKGQRQRVSRCVWSPLCDISCQCVLVHLYQPFAPSYLKLFTMQLYYPYSGSLLLCSPIL